MTSWDLLRAVCKLVRTLNSMSTERESTIEEATLHMLLAKSWSFTNAQPNLVPAKPSCFEL